MKISPDLFDFLARDEGSGLVELLVLFSGLVSLSTVSPHFLDREAAVSCPDSDSLPCSDLSSPSSSSPEGCSKYGLFFVKTVLVVCPRVDRYRVGSVLSFCSAGRDSCLDLVLRDGIPNSMMLKLKSRCLLCM